MRQNIITTVFLDIDGTLIDSNDAHAHSWQDVLTAHGYDVPYEDLRLRIGKGGDKLLPEVTGLSTDSLQYKQISEERSKVFKKTYLAHIRPFAKVRDLLLSLKDAGLSLAVVTSASEADIDTFLDIAGVRDLIEYRIASDQVENSKPDPDLVLHALKTLDLKPSQAIMVGDTPYDIEAAARAGVRSIAFRSGGWSSHDLQGAIAIYADAQDLLRQLDTSVLV